MSERQKDAIVHTRLAQQLDLFFGRRKQLRLIVALDDLAGMNGEGDDGRTPTTLGCRYLHLIDEVAMSQMHPVEEANGGYSRGVLADMCLL